MATKRTTKTKTASGINKEPVRLREKVLANGNISLYLDVYRNGRRKKEYLKLYLVPEKTKKDKELNMQTLATAQAIKGKRQIELQNGEYSFTRQFAESTPFLGYFRQMCHDRFNATESKGNWGNWHSCLKYLEHYCDEATTFKEIDKEWIEGFKDYLDVVERETYKRTRNKDNGLFRGLSQNSKMSYFNKLRACINQAYEERIIPINPLRGVQGFKAEDVERVYLTMDELKALTRTPCKYEWMRAAFLFSCLTGLRKSDIEKLTWGEIHKFENYHRIIFKQKKTGCQEYLDINAQAYDLLGNPGDEDEKVFSGFSYSSQTLLELKRWCIAAGIHKDVTFHSGRHTFAVMMLTLGADIYTVSKLLGHRYLSTTEIYAKVIDKKKQNAIDLIPKLKDDEAKAESSL